MQRELAMKPGKEPLVSVVIASYNMGQYLPRAVDSVLFQTWKNLEVIVVDDGSTDGTDDVMKKYAHNDRVFYIRNDNQGQPKAKNCGLRKTKGDVVGFCDADDFWEPCKLTLQMPLFHNPRVGVVYSEVSNVDEYDRRYQKPPVYQRHRGKVTDQLLKCNFVPFGTALIRRACINQCGLFDEQFKMGIDWDLWLRYSLDWEFDYISDRTYVYREWSGQMSNNYRGRYDHALRILENFVRQHGDHLDPRKLRIARADTYANQASAIACHEKRFWEPLRGYIKSLRVAPFYGHAWRSFIKWLLGRQRTH